MPPLEAMACGCRAVISSDPALVEVAGPAALVVDPHDPPCAGGGGRHARLRLAAAAAHRAARAAPRAGLLLAAGGDTDARRLRARGRGSDPRAEPQRRAQRHRLDTASDAPIVERMQPGKYILVCFLSARNGKLHYQLGMKKQFTVAGDTGARPPKVDGIVLARDKKMEVPTVGPGRQTLELRNAAKKPRGFDLVTFEPGKRPRETLTAAPREVRRASRRQSCWG
jgi:hypothetical protein